MKPNSELIETATLHNAGLYVTHARGLYDEADFAQVYDHVQKWLASNTVKEECRKFAEGTRQAGLKAYVVKYNESRVYPKDDPLLKLVNPKVQAIVEQAIGPAKCICIDLWHNPPNCNEREKVWSQAWHRDPEDPNVVKVFIYFADIADENGPFEYVLCSHVSFFDVCPPCRYPKEPISTETIPAQLFARVTGKAGTIAFCQTSGLHKGGHGEKARTMAVLSWVPEQSTAQTLFKVQG